MKKQSDNYLHDTFNQLVVFEATQEINIKTAQDGLSIFKNALDSSISGHIITDLIGIIYYANPSFCRLFEFIESEVIGKNAMDLFASKEVRRFSDIITLIDISKDDFGEFNVVTGRGGRLVVELMASSLTSISGELIGRIASFNDITLRKKVEEERENLIYRLQDALDRIKTLRGIIPICASCKQIRDDKGIWNQLESYIRDHSDAVFSHSICPECTKKLYPE